MNIRLSNQLNMVGACLNVANTTENKLVWTGKDPADFGVDIVQLQTAFAAVTQKAALADGATGGAGDAKAQAEAALEDAAYVLARALANHFKKTNNLDSLGKVDVSKSEIVQLRNQDLLDKTTSIRNSATSAQAEPGAAGRGVTVARIATLTAAINDFAKVINLPRGQVVNRSTLLKEVDTDTADLLEQVAALDDLVIQFDGTDAGKRFNEAWKRARIIVDTAVGHGTASTTPAPPAPRQHRRRLRPSRETFLPPGLTRRGHRLDADRRQIEQVMIRTLLKRCGTTVSMSSSPQEQRPAATQAAVNFCQSAE